MKGLTGKQQEILAFIEEFHRREQVPPTVYELAEHFDIKPATSFAHLRALQRKGYIERTSKARSLTLLKSPRRTHVSPMLSVPVLGRISAGLPLLAEENVEDTIKVDPGILPWGIGNQELFALRISGESMRDAGILDGDLVVAKQQRMAEPGEVVIALVDNESTIKYFYPQPPDKIELRPANPAFKPQIYPAWMVEVQGVAAALLRSL